MRLTPFLRRLGGGCGSRGLVAVAAAITAVATAYKIDYRRRRRRWLTSRRRRKTTLAVQMATLHLPPRCSRAARNSDGMFLLPASVAACLCICRRPVGCFLLTSHRQLTLAANCKRRPSIVSRSEAAAALIKLHRPLSSQF